MHIHYSFYAKSKLITSANFYISNFSDITDISISASSVPASHKNCHANLFYLSAIYANALSAHC